MAAVDMFQLEEDWDDRESSDSENLHDALFREDIPLLEHLSTPAERSLHEAANEDGCSPVHKKNRADAFPTSTNPLFIKTSKEQSTTSSAGMKGVLHKKMLSKISGARFRWINEQLYTSTGEEAREMFEQEPGLFDVYHKGFAQQVSKWPLNPLDRVISYVLCQPTSHIVADFGCGEAKLAQNVPNTVYSFDLVAVNSCVTSCDMANVPLSNSSVDICIFCLSLMGTNISEFIREARRVLKRNGSLKICEIASRFTSEDDFVDKVEWLGFKLISKEPFSKLFLDFEFKVIARKKSSIPVKMPEIELKACVYRRR